MEIMEYYRNCIWLEALYLTVIAGVTNAQNQTGKLVTVATQSSTFVSNGVPWSADKAVDNCFKKECIARTKDQPDSWIRLKLENVYKIISVIIHPVSPEICPTCHSIGLNGIRVEMSKIEGSQTCVYTYNVSDATASSIKIDAMDEGVPLPDSRYITIRKTKGLMVAEIEVFGECADNYCGKECTEFCFCRTPLNSTERLEGQNCKEGCLDGWTGKKCNIRNCDPKRFGFNCRHWNHCRQDCNPWTGECLGPDRRCEGNWSGPSCQKQKLEKPVYAGNESLIDNDVGSCVPTNTLDNNKVYVVLRELMKVSHIEFLFKPDFYPAFKPYRPGKVQLKCQKQNDELVFSESLERSSFLCEKTGVQILELSNLTGILCELELYVCAAGTFGSNCDERCHCLDYLDCVSIDGNCHGAGMCHAGWHGKACDQKCSNNTFGWSCQNRCHCADNSQCHHVSGKCPGGCAVGWEGPSCDKECSNNTFGWSCQNRCHCADNSQCHHVSGKCPGGCAVGSEGPSCDKDMVPSKCSNNTFGWSCQNRCHCADNSQCHRVNGKCPGGCAVGWEGPSCDKECTNGTYGPGCNKTCHCLNEERCDASTGICSDGCSSGWEGDSCDIMVTECANGTYGSRCNKTCHCINEEPCNVSSGICSGGCSSGWHGDACDTVVTVCSDGFYGINCSQRCGNCVDNTTCDHTTGNCSLGCAPGWKEHMCQSIACPEGFHGVNCSKQCGHCAINTSCDPETGHCEEGCESGWLSLGCNKKCPDGLYGATCSFTCGHCSANQSCDHITGHCSSGCNLGWIGPLCQRTCETGHFGFNCSALCGHCSGNQSCHYETGECLLDCETGWTGPFCINKYKGPKSFLESIIIPGPAAVLVLMIIIVITATVCRVRYRKKKLMQSNRKNYVDGHEMVYFVPDTEISDDSPYGGHAEATNEIKQTDYAEIHDVYEKLKGKRSTINFENFQEVYKHLLSVQRDGKTVLFHAYQSLKTAEPVYSTVADKIGNRENIANISYQELICQYQSLPRHGKGIHSQGSTHLLKFDGISYIVSDESLSSIPFWEAFERHSVYTCIHIGETNITRNTRARFGNVLVQCTESTTTHSYTEQNLIFQSPQTDSQINVTLLSSGVWEDYQEVPADPAWVVQIIEYMELNLKAKDIIMIHCRHSIEKAVMLSVMSGIYMKMKKTGSVDILGPTQTAWKLIPSSIGTYEQFKFLHDVALLVVKKYDKSS